MACGVLLPQIVSICKYMLTTSSVQCCVLDITVTLQRESLIHQWSEEKALKQSTPMNSFFFPHLWILVQNYRTLLDLLFFRHFHLHSTKITACVKLPVTQVQRDIGIDVFFGWMQLRPQNPSWGTSKLRVLGSQLLHENYKDWWLDGENSEIIEARGAWMAQSIKHWHLILAQVIISSSWDQAPWQVLCLVQGLLENLFFYPSPTCMLALTLSFSKINTILKKITEAKEKSWLENMRLFSSEHLILNLLWY